MKKEYKLKSKVWLYPGMAGWHFINVDKKASAEIKKNFGKGSRGFGSLPVTATIGPNAHNARAGKTSWNSSIFPDKKSGTYLLPLKAQIRKKEDIVANDTVSFSIKIRI